MTHVLPAENQYSQYTYIPTNIIRTHNKVDFRVVTIEIENVSILKWFCTNLV